MGESYITNCYVEGMKFMLELFIKKELILLQSYEVKKFIFKFRIILLMRNF